MGLLGERPEVSVDRSDEPKLLCLDDDQTEEVLRRLSSESSQAVFRAVTEEPMAAAEVAEALDMSVQNASYHLDNLESAGLIEVLDTHYSEKGQEVDIYGPPEEPLVLFLGTSDDRPGLVSAFKRFAGAVGPIAIPLAIGESLARLLGGEGE